MPLLDRLRHRPSRPGQRTVSDWSAVVDQHHRMVVALASAQSHSPRQRPAVPRPRRQVPLRADHPAPAG